MTDEIIALLNRPEKDHVIHLDNGQTPYFSGLYHQLREAEGRIYSDDILLNLPEIPKSHKLYSEWQQREASLNLLKAYLEDYPYNSLLDFGCGNGWMTHQLAQVKDATVLGIDIHLDELKQAARVFQRHNLKFLYGTNYNLDINGLEFDVVLLASSLQYIKNPREFLQNIWRILADNGEIHIIDTPFYEQSEIAAAKQRSSEYFSSVGFHEMTRFYYHHCYESLGPIEFEILNDPLPDWRRILNMFAIRSPFPWLKIKKSISV